MIYKTYTQVMNEESDDFNLRSFEFENLTIE